MLLWVIPRFTIGYVEGRHACLSLASRSLRREIKRAKQHLGRASRLLNMTPDYRMIARQRSDSCLLNHLHLQYLFLAYVGNQVHLSMMMIYQCIHRAAEPRLKARGRLRRHHEGGLRPEINLAR